MDREGIKKHKAVFDAWLDGAKIEVRYPGNVWIPAGGTGNTSEFSYGLEYRVKPEPKTREVWVNVYSGFDEIYRNPKTAHANITGGCIACAVPVTITFTPGEGLDGGDS